MKLVVTIPGDVACWTSELVVNPDDPEIWVAGLLGRQVVLAGEAASTRDGWPMQRFELRIRTPGASPELVLAALYTFLAHSAVCIVRGVDERRRDELRDALGSGRPDWNGDVTGLAQFYAEAAR